jgi:type I restriction enzyme S subunit
MSADWPRLPLGTLLRDIQPGFASGRHNSTGEGIPHFRPMNISTDGQIERSVMKFVDPAAGRPELRLAPGDILFNNTNSPELVGKTAYFEGSDSPAFSNHMTRLRVDDTKLDARFTALRLHQAWREGWFAAHCNNHVSQASISRSVLQSFEIELPPLEVQRAIASLSASVDGPKASAVAHILTARTTIERFRQSVLTAACTGRLTADWRVNNPGAAIELPETPRRVRGDRASVPLSIDNPELPSSYKLTTIGDAAQILEYGTSRKSDPDSTGIPVIRMGNIQNGELVLSDLKYCSLDSEIKRLMLRKGDLLFNRTNSPELVGKSAVFTGSVPMTFASYLIRVRFMDNVIEPEFAGYWINSAWGRLWAREVKTDGVSQSNINGTKLGSMPLPLPPFEEQKEIVSRTKELLATADSLLARVKSAENRLNISSEALLNKAFRGELPGLTVAPHDGSLI